MSDEPILELDTKTGMVKRHGLTMGQIEEAERLLAEGKLTAEEIAKKYPNWQEAARDAQTTLSEALESMHDVFRPIAESVRRAEWWTPLLEEIAVPKMDLPPLTFRDPDAATRQVADEVKDLAKITGALLENSRGQAAIIEASLKQTSALVSSVQALHETTRQGIAAGEKREQALVAMTISLVILTALLTLPVLFELLAESWTATEPVRSAVQIWFTELFATR
jgi:hypothetical protein